MLRFELSCLIKTTQILKIFPQCCIVNIIFNNYNFGLIVADNTIEDFFLNLEPFSTQDLVDALDTKKEKKTSSFHAHWIIKNEIKPVDLYCYLYAKYGPPRGLLTLMRNPHRGSDNLIQWDWMLKNEYSTVHIQGHNFRTEVFIKHNSIQPDLKVEDFIAQFKGDFKNHGRNISTVKKALEKWTEFVNPFFRIQSTVDQHFSKLAELELDLSKDKISNIFEVDDNSKWSEILNKYHFAVGLIYGLRSMLPVMAESFINCLIFILCKPEIKSDEKLYESIKREKIHLRVQNLHLNCNYFISTVDYSSDECKQFHTLMNDRNDLLHGNINIKKQSFGEVYFNQDMAIFDTYQDHWEKSIGVLIDSVKFHTIHDDLKVVENFIGYVLSKIHPQVAKELSMLLSKSYLGFNAKTGRVGILFPSHLVDFKPAMKKD